MTIEVVDSPDILVTVTAPDSIAVTVVRGGGGGGGISIIDDTTPTDLVGVLVGNGSTVSGTLDPTVDSLTLTDGTLAVVSADLTIDKPVITEGRLRVQLSTAVPTANFVVLHNADPTDGSGASITCRTDTTGAGATDRELGHIRWEILTHDDATRAADLVFGLSDNGSGAIERLRLKADGTVEHVGLYSLSTIDTIDNVLIAANDGPDSTHLDAISNNNYYTQFVNDNTGAKQFRFRTEYGGFGMGSCSADIVAGYLDGGSPFSGLGACNGTGSSGITVTGLYVDINANASVRVICQGFDITHLGTLYSFSETGFEVISAVDDAALASKLVNDCGMATQAYVDNALVSMVEDCGNYDASGNVFPSSGGSGIAGAVVQGDLWTVSVAGTLGGTAVTSGDTLRALVDTPGQTSSNWAVTENNFGFTPESSANKDTDGTLAANSDTKYASQKATKTYADLKLAKASNLSDLENAATARTNLGGTTVGQAIFTKANPSAVRFLRVNADNTIDFLTASEQDLAVGWNDPTEALRGSYHLLPMPSRPRWDVAENIPSSATGTGFGIGGLDWNASTGNVLSHPGGRNGSVYGANRMRTNCIGPTPVAGTQMAQLRTGTRAPISRSSNWDTFGYIIFRMPTLPALSQGWVGWKGTAAEITTTAVLQDTLNCLAMGYEQSGGSYETNWYIYHNDGSGTCTRINLGANFPTSTTAVYCLYICMQANSGNIAYQVNRLDLPQVASGLISSNIIVTDSQMFTHVYQTNGSTAVRCEVEAFHHFAAIKN